MRVNRTLSDLVFEDCVVDQLVGAVKEKDVEGAVCEQDQEQGKQRHAGGCEPGGNAS